MPDTVILPVNSAVLQIIMLYYNCRPVLTDKHLCRDNGQDVHRKKDDHFCFFRMMLKA